jgi:hypothetical protein
MPGIFQDLVREKTNSTGTSTLTMSAIVNRGFIAAGYVNNDPVLYSIFEVDSVGNVLAGGAYEQGVGFLSISGSTVMLARSKPLTSTNANAFVSFSSADKHVIVSPMADATIRPWSVNDCRLSYSVSDPYGFADQATPTVLYLLPTERGSQIGIPLITGDDNTGDVWGLASVRTGISLTLPTLAAAGTRSCTTTAGSRAVTHASTTAIPTGTLISGTGIPAGTYVIASTATGATLSRAATASGTVTLTWYLAVFNVYVRCVSGTTANKNALTGMQSIELYLKPWANNNSPPTSFIHTLSGKARDNTGGTGDGLYVGTLVYYSTTQGYDSTARRFLFNAFNQVPRRLFVQDAAANYAYNTATWRIANADWNNQVEFVAGDPSVGYPKPFVLDITLHSTMGTVAGSNAACGPIADADVGPGTPNFRQIGASATQVPVTARKTDHPGHGYHQVYMGEFGHATGATFYGGGSGGNTLTGFVLG